MGHFKGYFEGAKTFLIPKLSLAALGTILGSKKSEKKIISGIFKISGALIVKVWMHLKVFLKLKKPFKNLSSGQISI
jgi:hypothetical protein